MYSELQLEPTIYEETPIKPVLFRLSANDTLDKLAASIDNLNKKVNSIADNTIQDKKQNELNKLNLDSTVQTMKELTSIVTEQNKNIANILYSIQDIQNNMKKMQDNITKLQSNSDAIKEKLDEFE